MMHLVKFALSKKARKTEFKVKLSPPPFSLFVKLHKISNSPGGWLNAEMPGQREEADEEDTFWPKLGAGESP